MSIDYCALEIRRSDPDFAEITEPWLVVVDYDLSVEEAVRRCGYDLICEGIDDDHFPFERRRRGQHVVEMHLQHYIYPSIEKTRKKFFAEGFGFADPLETLAFGERYPDIQRKIKYEALQPFAQYDFGRFVLRLSGDPVCRKIGRFSVGALRDPDADMFLTVRHLTTVL